MPAGGSRPLHHKLCFTAGDIEVVAGGRLRTVLTCPDSEWLDPRRNVFEFGRAALPGPPGLAGFLAGLTGAPGSCAHPGGAKRIVGAGHRC